MPYGHGETSGGLRLSLGIVGRLLLDRGRRRRGNRFRDLDGSGNDRRVLRQGQHTKSDEYRNADTGSD